jgi:hypothetical protein
MAGIVEEQPVPLVKLLGELIHHVVFYKSGANNLIGHDIDLIEATPQEKIIPHVLEIIPNKGKRLHIKVVTDSNQKCNAALEGKLVPRRKHHFCEVFEK